MTDKGPTTMSITNAQPAATPGKPDETPFDAIARALANLRFGAILLTVHEGRLVQMDVTEKRRFVA